VRCPDPERFTRRVFAPGHATALLLDERRTRAGVPMRAADRRARRGVDDRGYPGRRSDGSTASARRVLAIVNCSPRVEAGVVLVGCGAVKRSIHPRCASEPGVGVVALDEPDVAVKGVGVRIRGQFDATDALPASRCQ
jgi:hypothetical protein